MCETTERPWAEDASPTPEQLADWLTRCTEPERVAVCARMLDSAVRARRCFEMDHEALQAEVEHLRRLLEPTLIEQLEAEHREWVAAVRATLDRETRAATPGGEYAARYERAVFALRAICRPEHFDGALLEARKRQQERGLGAVGAVDSVYDDVALGWVPSAAPLAPTPGAP